MAKNIKQPELSFPKEKGRKLDVPALESWLWDAACVIRGPLDAPKFKDYILPLIFLKRLSDVFDDEIAAWSQKMKVQPKEVHVRPMPRKWGSCSTAGRVCFSLDLLGEPYKLRKEIIVHELLHLKVPNHGKLFKALLKGYLAKDISPTEESD